MEELTHHFTVLVGSNNVPFVVPARSICAVSDYFDHGLNPYRDVIDPTVYPDAQPYYVYLPTEEPEIFELFLRWMLNLQFDNADTDMTNGVTEPLEVAPLVELYLLADKLGAPDCMRYVIYYLWFRMERITYIPIETCILVGERVHQDDALRQFLRDIILNNTELEGLCLTLFDRAPEFAQGLLQGALAAASQSTRADWYQLHDLQYYLHYVDSVEEPNEDYVEQEVIYLTGASAGPPQQKMLTTSGVRGGLMELPTRVKGEEPIQLPPRLRGGHMALPTRQR